jgi:MoxR-like ATPase
MSNVTGPEGYLADEALVDAINTAIFLGLPLLLTGPPGCGKSEVGDFVAWKLGLKKSIRFDVKSTTTARELFYSFDTVARFHAASEPRGKGESDRIIEPQRFIKFHGLGLAILHANEPENVADLVPRDEHPGQRRSVILIDEIDKAPRDVPNDLLVEIDRMQFYIGEMDRTVAAAKSFRPVVIVTSNSERSLPDPFLRRCVYLEMRFPDKELLRKIIERRVACLSPSSDLVGDALTVFQYLHDQPLRKKPGTAELLAFVMSVRDLGYQRLRDGDGWERVAQLTLLKHAEDQEQAFKRFSWTTMGAR